MEVFYKIGEVAEMLSIEQHTLRYLEGSLKIKIRRDERGDRIYSEADLDTLRLILQLKETGLNTTAIKLALETAQEGQGEEQTGLLLSSPQENNWVEVVSMARRIVEQNDELMQQNRKLEDKMNRLEKRVEERNLEREQKIDEFLRLWKAEQEGKGRSWLSWLRGK